MDNKIELSENLTAQLTELNQKVNELYGYSSNDIKKYISELQKNGNVIVGYRTSCGSTDRTQKAFRLWVKAVKLLSKNGIKLVEENLKVNNSYATLSGGFWNEIRYSLV